MLKIKILLITSLLFTLWAGNLNAQNGVTLPHTQDFENELGLWSYTAGSQHSGIEEEIANEENHVFHFQGSKSDAYLISPELTGTENGIRLAFGYTNYFVGSIPAGFRVGYSTFTADLEDFVWGDNRTVTNGDYDGDAETGDGDWATFVGDFPEGVKFVAIHVLPNSQSNLYVDNIEINVSNCASPALFQLTATTSNSISLGWQGNNDSYDVQYATPLFFDFEGGEGAIDAIGEEGWQSYGDGEKGTWICDGSVIGHDESDYCPYSDLEGFEGDNYLVSPLVPFGGSISFYAKYETSGDEGSDFKGNRDDVYNNTKFQVLIYQGESLDEFEPNSCEPISDEINAIEEDWTQYTFSLESFENQQGFVIIRHINDASVAKEIFNCQLLIDDVTILDWETGETEVLNYTISNLEPETQYVVRMRGNNGETHSSWTDPLLVKTFPTTAPTSYTFTTAGDWNKPSNWADMYIPQQVTDVVTVNAAAIIPEGCEAKGNISLGTNGSIIIKDGGQLYTEEVVEATIKKRIKGYTIRENDATDPDNMVLSDGWYFISYPLNCDYTAGGDDATGVGNMITSTSDFDLYHFDSNQELEWRNYKDNTNDLKLVTGHGYLYANDNDVTLKFEGSLNYRNPDADFVSLENGWNLVGNPFAYNTYPGMPYYKMNAEGTAIEATEYTTADAIAPCTGILVYNDGDDNAIAFSKDSPNTTNGSLHFAVSQIVTDRGVSPVTDNAIVSFNEGSQLKKFYFGAQKAKLYIPRGEKDYAIVYSNKQGEMPLNFQTEEEATYTITIAIEGEEMDYLHLIDNMTGADVDLLQTPSYTFDARTTDYASRFRLVFATTDAEEDSASAGSAAFAFNSNGSWIILNDGQATLQVVDVMGRLVSSETINGNAEISLNQPAGIYMLRLVNGNDVKVQKVVVR